MVLSDDLLKLLCFYEPHWYLIGPQAGFEFLWFPIKDKMLWLLFETQFSALRVEEMEGPEPVTLNYE